MIAFGVGIIPALASSEISSNDLLASGIWLNLCLGVVFVAVVLLRRRLNPSAPASEQINAKLVARLSPRVALYRVHFNSQEILLGLSGDRLAMLARSAVKRASCGNEKQED